MALLDRPRRLILAVAAVSWCHPLSVAAQTPSRVFPGREYLPLLLAGSREPATLARLVVVSQNPNEFGNGVEGDVALGASLPVLRLAGGSPEHALVVGVQGGVFARFDMEVKERDLITTDWVFAVPFVLRRGGHWLRFRYFHMSSHLGDEYAERFNAERYDYTRDWAELLAFLRLGSGVGVYGSGGWAFNVDPNGAKRWRTRVGGEARGPRLSNAARLYGAVDVEMEQDNGWEPRMNLQTGVRLTTVGGRDARIAVDVVTGPSPQGQFADAHTTFVTAGIYVGL